MKKTTLKDVAKEAGVSIATASYVLNKVANQTIPADTRQRVLDAAAKLDYVQNLTARSLSRGRSNLLGVLLVGEETDLISKYISYGKFIDELERLSNAANYHLMVARIDPNRPNFAIIAERKLDGVFLIDARESSFYAVSSNFPYGSPLILIDGMIEDPLFRQLTPDFGGLFERVRRKLGNDAPFAVVHESYHNDAIARALRSAAGLGDDRAWAANGDEEGLRNFLRQCGDLPIVVFNEFLALRLTGLVNASRMIVVCTSGCPEYLPADVGRIVPKTSKAQAAFAMMTALLQASCDDRPADGLLSFAEYDGLINSE
ncbi:LacI family DNA-binding transcriptional regulator [Cohnella thermotolerans]|uniref:LacI family DNA-binding transcriptional regulator n=1 Tax=Cohnella thermotolerans TaxID=329858 RepID=UPI00040D6C9D|nr:LacI family DNA-binding transcriptional regulator [Cohnella thermotolerans]